MKFGHAKVPEAEGNCKSGGEGLETRLEAARPSPGRDTLPHIGDRQFRVKG